MKSGGVTKLLLTAGVYAAGVATFAFAVNQILLFAGMPGATSYFVAMPVGAIIFILFIWANWDGDFGYLIKRRRTPVWPSDAFDIHREPTGKNEAMGDERPPREHREPVVVVASSKASRGRAVNINYILCVVVTLGWLLYRLWFDLDVYYEFLGIPRQGHGGVGLGVVIIEGVVLYTALSGYTIKGFNLSRLISGIVGSEGIFQLMVLPLFKSHDFGHGLDWWLGCYVWASHLGLGIFGNFPWMWSSWFRKQGLR